MRIRSLISAPRLPPGQQASSSAFPARSTAARRTVIDAPNIPSLHGLPLADQLAELTGLPVWLEHDGALLLLGEQAAGSAAGADLVLGVFFGTGIGSAFLKGGQPQKGGDFAMQLGHIPVRGDGRQCPCGGIDCIEAYASGLVLSELARQHSVGIDRLFTDRRTSPALDAALSAFVEDQALPIATAMTLFDPDVTVVGGGVIEMADFPLEQLFEAARRRLSPMFDRRAQTSCSCRTRLAGRPPRRAGRREPARRPEPRCSMVHKEAQRLKVGVLGCGPIAQAAHLESCAKARNADLYAICDVAPDLLERMRWTHAPERTYDDYAAMLADPSLEAVIIATSDAYHVPASIAALEAGKHVLCEKPVRRRPSMRWSACAPPRGTHLACFRSVT